MSILIQDLRQAIRQLTRRPIFTATAVLTLAIGMGVNAVAFGVVNGLLFKGYVLSGIPHTGRIITLPGGDESGYASIPEYERFTEATAGTLDIAAEGRSSIAWKHDSTTETAWTLYVSRQYFSLVTPPLVAGRLAVGRDGDSLSIMIGERFWREKLASRSLAGLTLRLNNTDVNVAGVIAESWTGPAGIYSPDAWLPLDELALFGASSRLQDRATRWLFVMGRLHDDATPAQVNDIVKSAAADMVRDWPETHKGRAALFRMFGGSNSELRGIAYGAAIGMGVIGLVLLLACFNVANLLLAQAVERERDMAVRAALGAKPSRLMRLVITEGFVIAIVSGAVALLIAWWTQSIVGSFAMPIEEPQHIDLSPDFRVGVFVAVLVLIAGILPGVWPAIAAARLDLLRVLGSKGRGGGTRPSRMRRWLIAAQIAGSTAFLALAALLLQSYSVLATFDVGFARDRLVLADVSPASIGYTAERSKQYVNALETRVAALPGVSDVALVDRAPFFIGFDRRVPLWPENGTCDDGNCRSCPVYAAGPGYFRTMGVAMAEGREFTSESGGQIVINTALAQLLWPNGTAVGKTLRIGERGERATIVGVTAPSRTRGLDHETPALFMPLALEHFGREIYQQIGEEGFTRLVAAFYAQVPTDDILGPMYPKEDLHGAEERLRDFLVGRFGGPPRYMEQRGHPRLRMRHMPFKLDQGARDRWVQLMDRALDDAKLPKESEELLRGFFHHMATFLMNTPA